MQFTSPECKSRAGQRLSSENTGIHRAMDVAWQ